jgi:hypothetical protein
MDGEGGHRFELAELVLDAVPARHSSHPHTVEEWLRNRCSSRHVGLLRYEKRLR